VDYLLQHGEQPMPEALLDAVNNSFSLSTLGRRSQDHFERCVKLLIDAGTLKNVTPEEGGHMLSAAMLRAGKAAEIPPY
jgi:hypothetical protein